MLFLFHKHQVYKHAQAFIFWRRGARRASEQEEACRKGRKERKGKGEKEKEGKERKKEGKERKKEKLVIQGLHMVSGTRCPAGSDSVMK